MPTPCSITGIILAAGESRRMGSTKQLMDLNGARLLQWVVSAAENSCLDNVIVVLGHQYQEILPQIQLNRSIVIINPDYQEGLSASVRAGITALGPLTDAVMVLLGDQPFITQPIINQLVSYHQRSRSPILVPTRQSKRGNPVIIRKELFTEFSTLTGDVGGKQIMTRYPDKVEEIEVDHPAVLADIDTKSAYDKAQTDTLTSNIIWRPSHKSLRSLLTTMDDTPVITLVGGGGKTSLMFQLASEYQQSGQKALVTTTTAIFHPDRDQYPHQNVITGSVDRLLAEASPVDPGITVWAKTHDQTKNKLMGVEASVIEDVSKLGIFDLVVVEADGAKHLPVKAPAEYEPVIPSCVTMVMGVIGLDCIDQPVSSEWVHRVERFVAVTGTPPGAPITIDTIFQLIISPEGLFKSAPTHAKKTLILNKADTPSGIKTAVAICQELWKNKPDHDIDQTLISSFTNGGVLFEIRFQAKSSSNQATLF